MVTGWAKASKVPTIGSGAASPRRHPPFSHPPLQWGRVPALNTNQAFIDDLADAVIEALPYVGQLVGPAAEKSLVPIGEGEDGMGGPRSARGVRGGGIGSDKQIHGELKKQHLCGHITVVSRSALMKAPSRHSPLSPHSPSLPSPPCPSGDLDSLLEAYDHSSPPSYQATSTLCSRPTTASGARCHRRSTFGSGDGRRAPRRGTGVWP